MEWKRSEEGAAMPVSCPHCRSFDQALGALLVGELEGDDLVRAGQHLGYCVPCRTTVVELSQVARRLRRTAVYGRAHGMAQAR
jgi:predicted anti-sigma-YlaC factor YlaD